KLFVIFFLCLSFNAVNAAAAVCSSAICDNSSTGFNVVGIWSTSTTSPGYMGSNYRHDKNSDDGTKTANWNYAIGVNGDYEIAAQWSQDPNRATNVQYRYSVNGGSLQNCGSRISQRVNGGKLNVLCSISGLAAGSTLTVSLRNDATGGYVIADAVRVTAQAVTTGISHFWQFGYISNNTFKNQTGGFATCSNCPDKLPGVVGNALGFDGQNNRLVYPFESRLNWGMGTSATVEFWFKKSGNCLTPEAVVSRANDGNGVSWWVGCDNNHAAFSIVGIGGVTQSYVTGITDITDGAWHHLAAIREATTSNQILFVDGKLETVSEKSFHLRVDKYLRPDYWWHELLGCGQFSGRAG
ncbi:MAG: hypothetical protein IPN62_17465, partial [Flavobacteriales bacterium]|nr:hypothetical protein [Flavobacteriales bacterium]